MQKKSSKSCLKSRANITNYKSVIVSNRSACVVGAASASTTELRDTLPKQIVREENTWPGLKYLRLYGYGTLINACQKIETRYGLRNRYSCEIKDIVGSRQRVTFWRKTSDEMCVELNKSYIFSKLVLENFPEEKPHFLLCARDEDVSLASDDFQNQMKSIESWDKQFEGMVLAIHSTLTYISCPFCKRSLKQADFKDGDQCGRTGCKKIVEKSVKDYLFVVHLLCIGNLFINVNDIKQNSETKLVTYIIIRHI